MAENYGYYKNGSLATYNDTATSISGGDVKVLKKTSVSLGSVSGQEYDGAAITSPTDLTVTGAEKDDVTFQYYKDNNGIQGDTLSTAPTDAGTYWVKAVIVETNKLAPSESVAKRFTITPKPLTITGLTATNRSYAEGNTTVTLTGGTLEGVVGTDNVTCTMPTSGAIQSADVGVSKAVTVAKPTLTGTKAGNYTLNNITGITVNITQAPKNTPTVPTIDYVQETLAVALEVSWKVGQSAYQPCSTTMNLSDFGWNGSTEVSVDFIVKGEGNYCDSASVSLTIPVRKAAPDSSLFTVTRPTATGGSDGKLIATTTGTNLYEYKKGEDSSWTTWNEATSETSGNMLALWLALGVLVIAVIGGMVIYARKKREEE